jgi:hypothetical protein
VEQKLASSHLLEILNCPTVISSAAAVATRKLFEKLKEKTSNRVRQLDEVNPPEPAWRSKYSDSMWAGTGNLHPSGTIPGNWRHGFSLNGLGRRGFTFGWS